MRSITRFGIVGGLLGMLVMLCGITPGLAQNPEEGVDVALVLAVDVSASVDPTRWVIQRDGYEAAFRDPEVIKAIMSGYHGAIAVTFVEWAAPSQSQEVAWTVIYNEESSLTFAQMIAHVTRRGDLGRSTSISGAIGYSTYLVLHTLFYQAERKVIDVSGDGIQNFPTTGSSADVEAARAIALSHNITINGLPILGGDRESEPLDYHYKTHVIGGPGAFMVVAKDWQDLAGAIRRKLVLEIAGLTPPEASQYASK